ncbi:hypothetical protein PCASD_20258 [Puccinia coronata f. sp. avenae]|uniref:Uncharacterized protein n=1 Tax=Puccinia coronata f. sp. avenae TaxID=200324 RepID=A0A2N5S8N9_9BASI|nr:hypothetical protein PCASD_20258 [Puccinia coronata f. sp. avenae]
MAIGTRVPVAGTGTCPNFTPNKAPSPPAPPRGCWWVHWRCTGGTHPHKPHAPLKGNKKACVGCTPSRTGMEPPHAEQAPHAFKWRADACPTCCTAGQACAAGAQRPAHEPPAGGPLLLDGQYVLVIKREDLFRSMAIKQEDLSRLMAIKQEDLSRLMAIKQEDLSRLMAIKQEDLSRLMAIKQEDLSRLMAIKQEDLSRLMAIKQEDLSRLMAIKQEDLSC